MVAEGYAGLADLICGVEGEPPSEDSVRLELPPLRVALTAWQGGIPLLRKGVHGVSM